MEGVVILKVAIFCDDIELGDNLFLTLLTSEHFRCVSIYENLIKGFEATKKDMCEIVFIDAREKEGPGIELAARLLEIMPETKVVFIANDGRNAMEGFRLGILDYIVLPIEMEDINRLVNKISNRMQIA